MRLFWLGVAWLAGIALGQLSGLPGWVFLGGISLAVAIWWLGEPWLRRLAPAVLLLSLGGFRLALARPNFDHTHISAHNDLLRPLILIGFVKDDPQVRDAYIGLRVESELVRDLASGEPQPVQGLVFVQADRFLELAYGDRIQATGFLETPGDSDSFSYRQYLARQGVHSVMQNAEVAVLASRQANPIMQSIFDLRRHAHETLHLLFPDPEASLLAGILLGIETGISPEVQEAFNATGTTHVIAISGFNLTILAGLVIRLFGRWLGVRRGAVAAGLVIGLYTVLVGADPAVVRAAVMGGLALFARFLGRRTDALASLSAAAMAMTVFSPMILWDVGFQLSFMATLGLVLYADPIQRAFVRFIRRWASRQRADRLAGPVGEYVLFTLAAQVTTLPLTAAYFRRLSLSSFLANPVILPAQPPLMVLGGLATIVGLISEAPGKLLALLAWPFPAFTIRAVSWFSDLPSASIELGEVGVLTIALFYFCLFGATAYVSLPPDHRPQLAWLPRPSAALGVLALAILSGVVWSEMARAPDGRTHLILLESGASLIETSDGRFILIGGGDSAVELSHELGRRIPLLKPEIDWLIITDTSEFRVRGLIDLLDRYQIGQAVIPATGGGAAFQRILQELADHHVPTSLAMRGQVWQLDPLARLEVADLGDGRMTLLLAHGRARILATTDSQPLSEQAPSVPDRLTALIVLDPYPSEWLNSMEATLRIAVGRPRNPDDWQLRTEQHGWIELKTDGERLWLSAEHAVEAGS